MSHLPSKYSSRGLSGNEARKIITTGTQRKNRPIGAIKIEERVNNVLEQSQYHQKGIDHDGDIQMVGTDNEQEVELIAKYVTDERSSNHSENTRWDSSGLSNSHDDERYRGPELKPTRETLMVVDTNFILSHLDIIDSLAKLNVKYHHKIVIPVTVVKELDGLKMSKRTTNDNTVDGKTVGHLARWANSWIFQKLADLNSSVRAQKLREFIDRSAVKDDAILDYCLFLQQKENALVILLSNDKNLCMKALANDVLTVSYRKGMTADLIAAKAFTENQSQATGIVNHYNHLQITGPSTTEKRYQQQESDSYQSPITDRRIYSASNDLMDQDIMDIESFDSTSQQQPQIQAQPLSVQDASHLTRIDDFREASELVFQEVQKVVLDAIDQCMFEEYGEDIDMIGYDKSKMRTLLDSSKTIITYWVSVFTEYFQRGAFKPFNTRGRKDPVFTHVPKDGTELSNFVEYWSHVLRGLYIKRDDRQNDALEKIVERWTYIANHSSQ
jgi:rRNA-processing protein FCF1